MKKLLTIGLLLCVTFAFAQKKEEAKPESVKFTFSTYEKGEEADYKTFVKQSMSVRKQIGQRDSVRSQFIQKFIVLNLKEKNIDIARVSVHPDSLRVTPDGVELLLKKEKAKK
jgi:hypothetical protein